MTPPIRRVHFSLHFERDFDRFTQVASCLYPTHSVALPFLDRDTWDRLSSRGTAVLQRWGHLRILASDLVIVLIGAQTYARPLVRQEIATAVEKRRPIFGIELAGMKNSDGSVDSGKSQSPFDFVMSSEQRTFKSFPWLDSLQSKITIRTWIDEFTIGRPTLGVNRGNAR